MMVEYFPRRMIAEKLSEGWRLVPGHSYNVSDYAILMVLPDVPEPLTAAAIRTTAARFRPKPRTSNLSAAATSRMVTRPRRVSA